MTSNDLKMNHLIQTGSNNFDFLTLYFILLNYHSKSFLFFILEKKSNFLKLCKFNNFVNRAGTAGLLPGPDFMELIIELFEQNHFCLLTKRRG